MRRRPLFWLLLSVLCFTAAYYSWRLGDHWAAKRSAVPPGQSPTTVTHHAPRTTPPPPIQLLSRAGTLNIPPAPDTPTKPETRATNRLALRLSNTASPLSQLLRNDNAILLENALLDTARPATLPIPDHLRAQGDPGSYIVQARGPIDAAFRSRLKAAGATIISYIPNNAYLVRVSGAVARQLQSDPRTQSVLSYEPYYKLKPSLLKLAVKQEPLPDGSELNLLLFADAREQTLADLRNLGVEVLGEDRSPFGPVVRVRPPVESLPFLASSPGVQELEMALVRAAANDLSRVRVGVSVDTLGPTNYLNLTGTNVLVNVNDSGVDATHPDLAPRVLAVDTNALTDPNGHGTHIAGIIASSGFSSTNPVNVGGAASGSVSNASFRGKAPAARLFVQSLGMLTGPVASGATLRWPSDSYLQQTAAQTNAFISNNSWNFVGGDSQTYDLHAASYDAAVRDALPAVSGSQPLLIVFPAGNAGIGDNDGTLGRPDTIQTPGTAKNVITVGAIEQLRNITNETWKCTPPTSTANCTTNVPWKDMTDSSDQVAAFSSRGNVGIGIEGDFGRFKPDVVAPGTFVASTRSGQWDTNAYYNPTSHLFAITEGLIVESNAVWPNAVIVPFNAVQLNLTVVPNTNSPVPFPDLLLYVNQAVPPTNAASATLTGTNHVSLPPDQPLSPVGTNWFYAVGNTTTQAVSFDLVTDIVVTNDLGNYLQVLAGLNDSLGPYYRYESGTSIAAAEASGTLALMQEFFESRLSLTNHSPALMKALLINGARSLSDSYDFDVRPPVNWQGWGLINLPTSLPGALTNLSASTNTIFVVDQNATNALATGQSHTRFVSLSPAAQNQILRITLVWTDPPGNPIASTKLVNDLDLIVTNLQNGDVFAGNDIQSGTDFNLPTATNTVPLFDLVNNVENVYLSPALGSNYSVTVVGRRVNVNAVTANPDNVAQDYALVVSSGDGEPANTFSVNTSAPVVYQTQPLVTVISNTFVGARGFVGGFLFNQRVGASTPLLGTNSVLLPLQADGVLTLGMTNQWHFYAISNNTSFTNAAFVTFLPPNLAVPREGVFASSAEQATRPEADIDLYVAPPTLPINYALTNLDPAVIDAASKSQTRGGTETIIYSNATDGFYYVGVKSEDQQAAQYAILAVFSERPFGTSNTNGDWSLLGIPSPAPIPDASVNPSGFRVPGVATIVCLAPQQVKLHRVIVTNNLTHELMGDLLGTLTHAQTPVVLNNHSPDSAVVDQTYIYDDSEEGNVPNAQHTDGPGSLVAFANQEGFGPWILTEVDSGPTHEGTNNFLEMFLERQQNMADSGGITAIILGGRCRSDFVDVPPEAVSMTVSVGIISATAPVQITLEVCPANGGPCKGTFITNSLGGSVTIDQTDLPPLQAGGTYRVRVCNLTATQVTVNIRARFELSFTTINPVVTAQTTVPVPILDDAVTFVYLTNNLHQTVSSLDVGLLINDPRVSDLAITLISPHGTRVLLFENRGALTTNGLGIGTFNLQVVTNMSPVYTNNFDLASVGLYAPGAVFQGWTVLSNFVDVLDDYTCLCLSNHVLALFDGAVSNSLPTTNAVSFPALNPYTLSYRVNHLPWLEGMVTWWPLDVDASDIFGGLNGLPLGDAVFSTGATNLFSDEFNSGSLNPMWQPALPDAGTGGGATPIEVYAGAPNFGFGTVGTNLVLRLSNTLSPLQRRGWSSAAIFNARDFRYEVRFNTLDQGAGVSVDGFLEIWILDATNTNRYDMVSPFGGNNGANRSLLAGSSIDGSYNTLPFNFQNNTWYRLVLTAPPNQGVRAAVLSDDGTELAGVSFGHGALAFSSGFRIVLSQFVGALAAAAPVDVAVDYARLTSGQSGEVNQAFFGDGLATRMVVPRCPALDLGLGRGFSVEGWVNPANPAPVNTSTNSSVIAGPITNPANGHWYYLLGLMYWPDAEAQAIALGGHLVTINDAAENTWVFNTFGNYGGVSRNLYLGFTDEGHEGQWVWTSGEPVTYANWNSGEPNNGVGIWPYENRSAMYGPAGSAPGFWNDVVGIDLPGYPVQGQSFAVAEVTPVAPVAPAAPLVEWNNPGTTNGTPEGVQLWLGGLPGTNGFPGSLWANLWDTNSQPHVITTVTNAITNGGWQHVALTYETNSNTAILYTNGQTAATFKFPTTFVPRTSGDLYLGYHPPGLPSGACYPGGLDEFSVYQRALSPCEVNAIFNAGSRGKYGTNVLVCPVATEVTLLTALGSKTYAFTNGLTWTNNGPFWETNTISFSTSTNPTAIVVRGLDPYNPADTNAPNNLNALVDDFILSALVTNTLNGLLHFTEDTNLAVLPIKFAPTPYIASNFPPVLIFSNDFVNALPGPYTNGDVILGGTNSPAVGIRDWTVSSGPVTVVSNAYIGMVTTQWLAMATGTVQCLLPTTPGHRYQLSYNLRGPCAVGWWNGSVDPLSQRARDLISGNNGAFFYGATNTSAAFNGDTAETYVAPGGLYFNGMTTPGTSGNPDIASKIEIGDPPQLQLTNSFTIETWIKPIAQSNDAWFPERQEQLFFRGDSRNCHDPYRFFLEQTGPDSFDLNLQIQSADNPTCGVILETADHPLNIDGQWHHLAAVFESNIPWTNNAPWPTNEMRFYFDGQRLTNVFLEDPAYVRIIQTAYTGQSPFRDLDPAFSPGVTIGNLSRSDASEPYRGFMDEMTVYARALTGPEIAAIAAAGTAGKADLSVPPAQSLAKLSVSVDGGRLGVAYGDNSRWTTHTVEFTALQTNTVVAFQSLLPGTLLEGVTLSELPPELYYLPEVPLSDIYGEDAFGVWTLEIWDNRVGPSTNNAQLIEWLLNFGLAPSNPPPIITLSHGIPYTNSLPAHGIQYFNVPVPQWAALATNILEFATQVRAANPLNVTVLFNQTNYPSLADLPLFGPPAPSGTNVLTTNSTPPLGTNQPYYLAVTNPNPVGVTFALGVWFDITSLTNCQMATNFVGPAGIPRYFQFDVPTNGQPDTLPSQAVSFWLSGANSNLTVVLSEHLPLPDLNHFDYISQQPCTNDEIVMLVTNTTPFPIQTNRWYVGVFNTTATNVPFSVQACVNTDYPLIIPLTNGIPFVVPFGISPFAAPPGPPQRLFFDFDITNFVTGVLFELYNLSGDADLVLQRDVPPTMAPYFDGGFFTGTAPEQIVVRASSDLPDLRGHWYLGVYNNERSNVAYTVRAVLPNANGLLVSAQPLDKTYTFLDPPHGLLISWHSVEGESYMVQYTADIGAPVVWTSIGFVTATTPLTTFEVLPVPSGIAIYRIVQVFSARPILFIQLWPGNQVRLSWSTAYSGYTVQAEPDFLNVWANTGLPITVVGDEYVAFDTIGSAPKYYRLIK